jgi:hypothetical protein
MDSSFRTATGQKQAASIEHCGPQSLNPLAVRITPAITCRVTASEAPLLPGRLIAMLAPEY